jgi:hypothetical protein
MGAAPQAIKPGGGGIKTAANLRNSAPVSCISSLSARGLGRRCLKCVHRQRTTKEPQMITAFFTFVTVAFFAAIIANIAETVSATKAFA